MRGILFFDSRFDLVTGAQRSMLTLAAACRDRGEEVTVATLADGPLLAEARALQLHTEALGRPPRSVDAYRSRPARHLAAGVALPGVVVQALRLVMRERPECIVANTAGSMLYLGLGARMLRIPLVWYVRMDRRQRVLFPLAGRIADRILLVSDGVQRAFTPVERTRWQARMAVLHTGFRQLTATPGDPAALEQQLAQELGETLPSARPRFLLLGTYDPRKGHLDALEAFARYRQDGGRGALIFCGHQPPTSAYVEKVRARCSALGLDEHVTILGPTRHPRALLRVSDVAILPSRAEGLPRIVVEALAEGRQVITYPVAGVDQLVSDARCGTVLERADAGELAHAMLPCAPAGEHAGDGDADASLRRRAVAHLTVDRYVDGFLDIVEPLRPAQRTLQGKVE